MRNVFIVPTDNSSKLFLLDGQLIINNDQLITPKYYQHIYITSDEDIKEEDWGLSKLNEVILFGRSYTKELYKKIILTTDPILIENGVQSIDDSFLEWFVKNPNCEFVEAKLIEFEVDMGLGESCIENSSYYKIIIPQEELRQVRYSPGKYYHSSCAYCKISFIGSKRCTICPDCTLKEDRIELDNNINQKSEETLEEASERIINNDSLSWENDYARESFIKGAKSDAARDYWFAKFKNN